MNGQVFRLVFGNSLGLEVCWIVAPCRCDPKRGHWEVAGEVPEPDSESTVFEAAWSSFEHTEENSMSVWTECIVESG